MLYCFSAHDEVVFMFGENYCVINRNCQREFRRLDADPILVISLFMCKCVYSSCLILMSVSQIMRVRLYMTVLNR